MKKPIHKPQMLFFALTALAVGFGIALRLNGCRFFEFKSEQLMALLNGLDLPAKYFFLTHGMVSSVGFPNGPGMYQLAGVLTLFGKTPETMAAATAATGIATVFGLGFLAWRRLSPPAAAIAMILLGCLPVLIFLAANFWAQVFMPAAMVVILGFSTRAIAQKRPWNMVAAVVLTIVTGMIHLSGFFLLPGLLYLFYRARFHWKYLGFAALGALAVAAPYLYYLAFEWHIQRFADPTAGLVKAAEFCRQLGECFGGGFLYEYFASDRLLPLEQRFGIVPARLIALAAAAIPWLGIAATLRRLGQRRRLPVLIEVSLALTASVLGFYLVFQVHLYFFYLFLLFPALVLIAAYGFSHFRLKWRTALIALWAAAALAMGAASQNFIERGGGHPREYGIHYGFYRQMIAGLREDEAKNGPLRLYLGFTPRAQGKTDPGTINYLFGDFFRPGGRPVKLLIDYDPAQCRYRCHLLPSGR